MATLKQLFRPIPSYDEQRTLKQGYRGVPIDFEADLFNEELVAVSSFDIDGVSYHSQPNPATVDPVPGVSPDIFLRKTLVQKIAAVKKYIKDNQETLAPILGGEFTIRVVDGYRSPRLQELLYEKVIPNLIRKERPSWSEAQVLKDRDSKIAKSNSTKDSMSPHATGAAVDLALIYTEPGKGVVPIIKKGPQVAGELPYPDYLEGLISDEEKAKHSPDVLKIAINARRLLYNLMTSDEFGGLATAVNHTEIWHYSYGDQMWARLLGESSAMYGLPSKDI